MSCPACGSPTKDTDWICAFCDHILDPSVLDETAPGDLDDAGREERTHVIAWDDHKNSQQMPEAVMLGDVSVAEQEFGVMHGAGSDGKGGTSTFLYYTSGSTTRVIHPDAIPRKAKADATIPRTPYEDFILSCIDGQRSVRAIQRASGLAPQEVVVTLLTLLDKGAVEIETSDGSAGSSDLDPPKPRARSRRVTPQPSAAGRPRKRSRAARGNSDATEMIPKSAPVARPRAQSLPDDFEDLPSVSDFEEIVDELEARETTRRASSLSDVWASTNSAVKVVEPTPLEEDAAEEVTKAVQILEKPKKRKRSKKKGRAKSSKATKKARRASKRGTSTTPPLASGPIPKVPPPVPEPSEVKRRTPPPVQDPSEKRRTPPPVPDPSEIKRRAPPPVPDPSENRRRAPPPVPDPSEVKRRGPPPVPDPSEVSPRLSSSREPVVNPRQTTEEELENALLAPTPPPLVIPADDPTPPPPPRVASVKPIPLDPSFLVEVPPSGTGPLPQGRALHDDDDDESPVIAPLGSPARKASDAEDIKEKRKRALAAAVKRGPIQERVRGRDGKKARPKKEEAPVSTPAAAPVAPQAEEPAAAPAERPEIDNARMVKAQKLFDQALVDKADGNLVSARMNMKLALTFDPTNELYTQAFEDLSKNPDAVPGGTPAGRSRARELYDEATEAENHGNVDRAIELLEKALAESKQAPFYNRLGVILATKKGEYVRAQKLIEQALELAPGNTLYEKNLSKVLSKAATAGMKSERGGEKKGGLLGFLGRRK